LAEDGKARAAKTVRGGSMYRKLAFVAGTTAFLALAAAGQAAAQDVEAGKKVFLRCQACHNIDKPQNKIGPHLDGVFGRKAGSIEDFKYSDAMKNSGITWDSESLHKYLADPRGFIPGNRMAFPGLKNQAELDNVIAYLQQATKKE
jgi:cytochrome c